MVRGLGRTVLIVGVSTRAAADSAARAGFDVTAIDAFGDLGQHPRVRALSMARDLGRRFTAPAVARAARAIEGDAVAYLSNFENHPAAVRALAAGRTLLGNSPEVLRRVRDPRELARVLGSLGFAVPEGERLLLKPLRSGGGQGVRAWRPGTPVPGGYHLQPLVDGVPGSISFVAAGGRSVPLAVCRQLIGESAFGASGYRYCGSILERCDRALLERAGALADAVSAAYGLVGVNGIDFVVRDGVPVAIEINPRWSASMELVDRASGAPVFAAHAAACTSGELPASDEAAPPPAAAFGKAIVFARRAVTVGGTGSWLEDDGVRDVPRPGESIAAGRPVCSVFATGIDGAACHDALVAKAGEVYAQLARWQEVVA
jgi:hypothetical protein